MGVDVIHEDPRWEKVDLQRLADQASEATLSHLKLDPNGWEITVLGCDDARISALNTEFREKTKPTNVLSWPSQDRAAKTPGTAPMPPEGDSELGDIALAYETCVTEAKSGGISLEDHTTHLIVHATLHLLGYDHRIEADGDLMEATEIAILKKLGLENPYIA